MTTAAGALELSFGRLARDLRPRAIELPDPPGAPPGPRVALAYSPRGLSDAEAALLRQLSTARWGEFRDAQGAREAWFSCEREELGRASSRSAAAEVFLAALAARERPAAPPELMGVVNVTPDSFSDGGRFFSESGRRLDPGPAVEHGLRLEADGATVLDVGGESTRPGAEPVPVAEELRRVLPVIQGLKERSRARLSVDTTKAEVARAALDLGAEIVNDVSGGSGDPAMLPLVAERRCAYVVMHMRGTPRDMQRAARYRDPVAEVADELRERVARCLQAGVELQRMALDPGIGFGKLLDHNLDLIRRLPELRSLGLPLCLGVSRKSFIAHATGRLQAGDWRGNPPSALDGGRSDRSGGTVAALVLCVLGGAELLRVHDVARAAEALAVAAAVLRRPTLPPGARTDEGSSPPPAAQWN